MDNNKTQLLWLIFYNLILVFGGLTVFTAFSAPYLMLSFFAISSLATITAIILSRSWSIDKLAAIYSTTTSSMVLSFIVLLVSSLRGPAYFWFEFWSSSVFKSLIVASFITLIFYRMFQLFVIYRSNFKRSILQSLGSVIIQFGTWISLIGLFLSIGGLENSLTVINQELLLIPFALSTILGITTHLNIPLAIPLYLGVFGIVIIIFGGMIFLIDKIIKK